jgi:hypothetical protein
MAIQLVIVDNSIGDAQERETRARVIPLATAEYFRAYWLRGADALRLKYVPLLYGGIRLEQEDLPFVLDELVLLRRWLCDHFANHEDGGSIERVDNLALHLREALGKGNLDISVG